MARTQQAAVTSAVRNVVTRAVTSAVQKPANPAERKSPGSEIHRIRGSLLESAEHLPYKRQAKRQADSGGFPRIPQVREVYDTWDERERNRPKPRAAAAPEADAADLMAEIVMGNDPALAAQLELKGRRLRSGEAVPPMIPVYSSNVRSIGYDENLQELFMSFKDGSLYKYYRIPPNLYEDLKYTADSGGSVGARFWDLIRIRGSQYGHRYSYLNMKQGKKRKQGKG